MNFAMVDKGIFRSGFPTRHNCAFLQQLGLRTIINLAGEDGIEHSGELKEWIFRQGLDAITCEVVASREPFVVPSSEEICRALRVLLDPSRHPVLVHSLRGDGPVGVVVGVLRRLQRWSLTSIFDEYRRFASGGATLLDLQIIETFSLSAIQPVGAISSEAMTHSPAADDTRQGSSNDLSAGT